MHRKKDLVALTNRGLYVEAADVYIDPWKKVNRALITHGHSDHARWGNKHYMCANSSVEILKHRLGNDLSIQGVAFGEKIYINGVNFSFHPAGHVAGSAQIRVEHKGEVCVVTGDYKTENDGITEPFELMRCNTIITECTFGLPVYIWDRQYLVMEQVHDWWASNSRDGKVSVITAYSLGKAQRLIHALDMNIGKVFCHPAIAKMNEVYRSSGFRLPETFVLSPSTTKKAVKGGLLVVPPAALDSKAIQNLGTLSTGIASGWMALRGNRRRRNADRGFVLSDHSDWISLNRVIEESGASRILTTHGYSVTFARWLSEKGLNAQPLNTEFGDNTSEDSDH